MLSIDELDEHEIPIVPVIYKNEIMINRWASIKEKRKRTHVDSIASSQAPPTIKTNKNSTK